MTQTLANRMTTDPQNAFLNCAPLPVQEEYLEQAQMNVQGGGDLESNFLTYSVGYAAATAVTFLSSPAAPVVLGVASVPVAIPVAIGLAAGAYVIAASTNPDLNDQIAETVASGVDALGDMASETLLIGESLLLGLMNARPAY